MLRDGLRYLSLTVLATTLSGCAIMGPFGENMWNHTRAFSAKTGHQITQFLRPAPPQPIDMALYDFETTGDADLNTQRLEGQLYVPPRPVKEEARGRFAPHMTLNAKPSASYMPDPVPAQSLNRLDPVPIAAPSDDRVAVKMTPQEAASDISFVKIGGGSDMADWQACESLAGGLFTMNATGYDILPEFEQCMRAKGYTTETEAEAEFARMDSRYLP